MAMDIYDTTTGTWTAGPPMPEARRITTAAAVGTRIYVGYSHGGACPASQRMLVFDTTTNTWSLGATLPAPRVAATSAVLDDKIYFVGGLSGASCGTAETRVDVYDPYLRANVVRRDRAALQAKGFPAARC